ncbi:MAG TPA: DUF4388 domain-containing protein [Pyrinomonadaceae bacterium]|jgi:hypothetical protein
MQNNRFVVLTGHLGNYPLSDLVGILRHQKKTGRLLIEYPKGPATFFFQDGELIDARLNDLIGLQAICVALAQPDAAFNFNPLIPATRRSIEPSLQRAVSELFGCWDESALQIETSAEMRSSLERKPEPLALPPAPVSGLRQRPLLFMAAAVLIGIGLSTVIVITAGSSANTPASAAEAPRTTVTQNPSLSVSSPEPGRSPASSAKPKPRLPKVANTDHTEQKLQSIKVVMQIENGRVLNASIANHKAGMDSYEAMALRIARQRRYPATATGGQTVTISVSPQQ